MAKAGKNTVRIIGGEWRRRLLSFPDLPGLRPTPDRVRETVFNWLGQTLDGLDVLDAFAGSGAMGLEAASRGARRVMLVEKAAPAAQSLRNQARELGMSRVEVTCADALAWLMHCRDSFDVIFLDPPFASELLARILPLAAERVRADGCIYIECGQWPTIPDGWQLVRSGQAGAVHYGLLRRVTDES
ncbi:16S rRNA (guanine(966)-N(2))-methyltransferase RsmD [Rivihabitans pingtungensis]|jgi:16S rRNA (guanine966-N2)-methyltransferase|uniref:16S rRNA (guanine(966)-N(2))-methyltransferase RsmD n=1 Tax=Rivihabitans pingtungensis TaxID=1054498 RepID=UPI002356F5BD|nr:16S rRNA (guanine(966)-N(2))-methyltransferase RsmD [Rivihabitans pingtungensis]MCK6436349.1 16S rRNA (guanine(966)-N(2))-methyltransferase RsmD [Rivihabitans pingtungensis]HNX71765.1 16S rRNA (guanine(966)-N(2))-methyltransferase RsmD [Rivihabitans pingtungensis]